MSLNVQVGNKVRALSTEEYSWGHVEKGQEFAVLNQKDINRLTFHDSENYFEIIDYTYTQPPEPPTHAELVKTTMDELIRQSSDLERQASSVRRRVEVLRKLI